MSEPEFPAYTEEARAAFERGQTVLLTETHEGKFWIRAEMKATDGKMATTLSMGPEFARRLLTSLENFLATGASP